ncbi:MAG TPA: large conductance mechanosensitive channel protein MscL [Candidatus Saccharimonadales bacterium]|nr:large conductance mechanosensitive channel protein MscL [Candidatus Saccharimonadales bacterium]
MLKEFRKFILRGNVVDLAVAVVVGAAFNSVVQSIVKDFITPLVQGIDRHSADLAKGQWLVAHRFTLQWGDFLNTLISFVVISAVVFFLVVQPINHLQTIANRAKTPEEKTDRKCPECLSAIPKAAKRCAFCTAAVEPIIKS